MLIYRGVGKHIVSEVEMIIATAYTMAEAREKQRAADTLIGIDEYDMILSGGDMSTRDGECIFNTVSIHRVGRTLMQGTVDERDTMIRPGKEFELDFVV